MTAHHFHSLMFSIVVIVQISLVAHGFVALSTRVPASRREAPGTSTAFVTTHSVARARAYRSLRKSRVKRSQTHRARLWTRARV